MFTNDLVNLYNRNIFKTSLYIYIFQDEKCRLMRNLSLSMIKQVRVKEKIKITKMPLFSVVLTAGLCNMQYASKP